MKKPLLLTLILTGLLCGCAPRLYEAESPKLSLINIIDQNDLTETISTPDRLRQYENTDFLACQPYKKVMRIYQRDCDGNVLAYLTSYHPNGQVWQFVEVINGRANGTYMEWYASGQPKIYGQVIGGEADLTQTAQQTWLFDGTTTVWDEQGQIAAELPYEKGLMEGTCLYYHPSGCLWKKVPFCQGKRHGEQEIYIESGELLSRANFDADEPSGSSQRLWLDGSIASDECFDKGRLLSGIYRDKSGREISRVVNGQGKRVLFAKDSVSSVVTITNGLPEGKVENYSTQGKLASYYHQKGGVKHGDEVVVYPGTLSPKLFITWREGKMLGPVKTWYRSGQIESQKELSDNKKNGLLTAWYLDGSLMLIEEYDQDKLVKGEYFRRGDKHAITEVLRGNGTATLFDSEGNLLRRVAYLNGIPDTR